MSKSRITETFTGGLFVLIQLYQNTFSILLGPCCRFAPSCSSYAFHSIERFGIMEGSWLALKRLVKCHPFHPGGYDPVPENTTNHSHPVCAIIGRDPGREAQGKQDRQGWIEALRKET